MKSDPAKTNSISANARKKRTLYFNDLLGKCSVSNAKVLDLGGSESYWKSNLQYIDKNRIKSIDIVNLPPVEKKVKTINDVEVFIYGGNALDEKTLQMKSYDLVFSNSVIEHVGNLRDQKQMANIISNQGQKYWVQTPAKKFPLEPHFYFPFFQYLPLSIKTFLHRHFNLGFMKKQPDWLSARIECECTRLLTKREFSRLFPDGEILFEKFFGFTKSIIVTNLVNKGHPHK